MAAEQEHIGTYKEAWERFFQPTEEGVITGRVFVESMGIMMAAVTSQVTDRPVTVDIAAFQEQVKKVVDEVAPDSTIDFPMFVGLMAKAVPVTYLFGLAAPINPGERTPHARPSTYETGFMGLDHGMGDDMGDHGMGDNMGDDMGDVTS